MTAIVDNKDLLLKVKMSKNSFVLARIFTALTNFGYTCIAYVLMLIIFRIEPNWYMLLFPIPVFFLTLFAMGMGYFLSIMYVFFADVKHLYSVILTLWMYLSAVFYPLSSLSPEMRQLVGFNPVFICINFARNCVMYQTCPEPIEWIKMIVWGLGVFILGYCFFRKHENSVMQKI